MVEEWYIKITVQVEVQLSEQEPTESTQGKCVSPAERSAASSTMTKIQYEQERADETHEAEMIQTCVPKKTKAIEI